MRGLIINAIIIAISALFRNPYAAMAACYGCGAFAEALFGAIFHAVFYAILAIIHAVVAHTHSGPAAPL